MKAEGPTFTKRDASPAVRRTIENADFEDDGPEHVPSISRVSPVTPLPPWIPRGDVAGEEFPRDYADAEEALGGDPERYVPAEQVRDIAQVVFHEVDLNSIQDLVYQIGLRVLERFPQLESVSFEANNRTWIEVRDDIDGDAKVLREPARPTGFQQFSMDRSDLAEEHR